MRGAGAHIMHVKRIIIFIALIFKASNMNNTLEDM